VARHGLVERTHLLWRGDLGHQDDVGPTDHDCVKIRNAVILERIDAHTGERPPGSPVFVEFGGDATRFRPPCWRREILELLDQHVGVTGGRRLQRLPIGAWQEQPRAPQRRRPPCDGSAHAPEKGGEPEPRHLQ
jgi:hypothetical protein